MPTQDVTPHRPTRRTWILFLFQSNESNASSACRLHGRCAPVQGLPPGLRQWTSSGGVSYVLIKYFLSNVKRITYMITYNRRIIKDMPRKKCRARHGSMVHKLMRLLFVSFDQVDSLHCRTGLDSFGCRCSRTCPSNTQDVSSNVMMLWVILGDLPGVTWSWVVFSPIQ